MPLNPVDILLNASELPPITEWDSALANKPPAPDPIIDGLLHRTAKMTLASGSKSFKTWSLMHLAIAVSTGQQWWGLTTRAAPVLYINFELQDYFAIDRMQTIATKLGLDSLPDLKVWNLRGFAGDFTHLAPKLDAAMAQHNIGMAIFDPIYKLYGSRDENSATDVAELLNMLEKLGKDHNCAIVLAHHHRKGTIGDNKAHDQMSGSGVYARDGDCLCNVLRLQEEDGFVVTTDLRNCPPLENFGIRWDFPVFVPDTTLNIDAIEGKKGTTAKVTSHEVSQLIPNLGLTRLQLREKLESEHGIKSSTSAYRYIETAIKNKTIAVSTTGDVLLRS